MITSEEKMLKFSMAIINYKFMTKTKKLDEDAAKKAFKDIIAGYQEAIVILKKILPKENSRQQMYPKFTWLASMAVQNLIDARKFTTIDKDLIAKSLNIKFQQDRDGKFKYDKNFDYRINIGSGFRSEIQTALITAAFLKDESTSAFYRTQIQKTVNFLKTNGGSWDGYPKVIAAYTLALSGDTVAAENFLRDVTSTSYTNTSPEFYSTSTEIASYVILIKLLLREDPEAEVKWILGQRNSDGIFYSPYSTVLAYQALYEYTVYKGMRTQTLQPASTIEEVVDGFGVSVTEEFGRESEAKINLKIFNNGIVFDVSNLIFIEVELPRGYVYTADKVQNENIEVSF